MRRLLTRSWYRRHVLNLTVVIAVLIMLGGTVTNAISNREQARANHHLALKAQRLASNLRRAVCTLRHDRQQAVADGRRFLQAHPHGIPGISVGDIRRNIRLQQTTVKAFRFAHCAPLKPEP